MPYFKTKPELMECIMERWARKDGFILIHDGSKNKDWDDAEAPSFFTRIYRLQVDDKLVSTWLRFTYDLRTGWADFKISYKDLSEYNQVIKEKENEGNRLGKEEVDRDTGKERDRAAREAH